MEVRRENPRLRCKRRESTDLFNEGSTSTSQSGAGTRPTTTPVRTNNASEDEDSPYFPCSTQDMNEDVDVLWDWNSPQSKPKTSLTRKSRKRLNLQHSPKVPFRRHPSNNNEQIKQDFNKLREELRALKAEIAKPDNEESLVLSPREEDAFRAEENDTHMHLMHDFDHNIEELYEDDFQDPFNDDMDEKLMLFSQQIETKVLEPMRLEKKNLHNVIVKNTDFASKNSSSLNTIQNSDAYSVKNGNLYNTNKNQSNLYSLPKITLSNCDNRLTRIKGEYLGQEKVNEPNKPSVMLQKWTEPRLAFQDSEVFNDSFDNALSQLKDEDLDQLTQVVDIKQYKSGNNECNIGKISKMFPRSLSEDLIVTETVQMTSGKVEWHRTQSFESYNAELSKETLQEIERKRLEAKAKRDAKKKQEMGPTITEISDSPIKCSPDEIEKKRLQALEKLEAKRLQDIIEKNKQEALKRREEKRKKYAANVKSSLSTRL